MFLHAILLVFLVVLARCWLGDELPQQVLRDRRARGDGREKGEDSKRVRTSVGEGNEGKGRVG